MNRTIKFGVSTLLIAVLMVCTVFCLAFSGKVTGYATETENIMTNGNVEPSDGNTVVGALVNNWIGLLTADAYGYSGQDTGAQAVMTMDTTTVHSGGSTKSLKSTQGKLNHWGTEHNYYTGYRLTSAQANYLDREMLLEGYIYSTTDNNTITLNMQLSNGSASNVIVNDVIPSTALTKDTWNKISVRFKISADKMQIDRTPGALGDAFVATNDKAFTLPTTYGYMDLEFRSTQGETVYYDDFSMTVIKATEEEPEPVDPDVIENFPATFPDTQEYSPNLAIESADPIDNGGWGDVNKFYYHPGFTNGLTRATGAAGLDASFDTDFKQELNDSTGSLKHPGTSTKTPMYRFFNNDSFVGKEFVLMGYLYSTEANTFSFSFNLLNSGYAAIYSNKVLYNVAIPAATWTKVGIRFKLDSTGLHYGAGLAKKATFTSDSGAAEFTNEVYVNGSFMTEAGKDVWYDNFTLIGPEDITDYSSKNYNNEYEGLDFGNIQGNIFEDADFSEDAGQSAANGKWYIYPKAANYWSGAVSMDKVTDVKLTGDSSYKLVSDGPSGQARYNMNTKSQLGEYSSIMKPSALYTLSVYVKIDDNTSAKTGVDFVVMFNDAAVYPSIVCDTVNFLNPDGTKFEGWRKLSFSISYELSEDKKTVTYSLNGGAIKTTSLGGEFVQPLIFVQPSKAATLYLDAASCFESYEGQIKFIDIDDNALSDSDLTLTVTDFLGNTLGSAFVYNNTSKYFECVEQKLPLFVSTVIDGKTYKKVLTAVTNDIIVCPKYTATVTIVNEAGAAFSGAAVKLTTENGLELVLTEEGTTGVYKIADIDDTLLYKVEVKSGNYLFTSGSIDYKNVNASITASVPAVITYKVTVTLIDAAFNPILGATIKLLENGEAIYTLTDKGNGKYELEGVEGFEFDIEVTKSGYTFESGKTSNNNRNITLKGTATNPSSGGGCGSEGCGGAAGVGTMSILLLGLALFKSKKR